MRDLRPCLAILLTAALLLPGGAAHTDSQDPALLPHAAVSPPGPPLPVGPSLADGHREILFTCPDPPVLGGGLPSPLGPTTVGVSADIVVYGAPPEFCPWKVYDDTHPFGNPQMMVFDEDPREMAFCALHDPSGNPDNQAHEYGRQGQTHTVFTSNDQGMSWADQPITPSQVPAPGQGDTSACVMDSQGRIFMAYLWTQTTGSGANHTYSGAIGLYEAGDASQRSGVVEAYGNPTTLRSRGPENPIDDVHMLRFERFSAPADIGNGTEPTSTDPPRTTAPPSKEPSGNGSQPANETGPGDLGDRATNETVVPETVVVSWFEQGPDLPAGYPRKYTYPDDQGRRQSGWIDLAWKSSKGTDSWQRLHDDEVIGPCREGSNAVQYEGLVYIACQVGKGYDHRERARIGQTDIWTFDPLTGETAYLDTLGLEVVGGKPRLAAAPDGYMFLTSHWIPEPEEGQDPFPQVHVAQGWYGKHWRYMGDFGPTLHQLAGLESFLDADVTALSVSKRDHTGLLFYKEWHGPSDDPPTVAELAAGARLHDFTKIVLSFNACDGPVAAREVVTGTGINAYQAEAYMANPGVYNDQQDGLQYTVDPRTGEELWYFAINDYGAMQYGGIVAAAVGDFCFQPAPITQLPPPPLPQALTVVNPATTAVGAALGAGTIAMVGYLLLARRKTPDTLAAEDR